MTLEKVIDQIEACRSENPECNECMSHVLFYEVWL